MKVREVKKKGGGGASQRKMRPEWLVEDNQAESKKCVRQRKQAMQKLRDKEKSISMIRV